MNSTIAIFIKQLQDIFKNMGVLVQFAVFPMMAFIMTRLVDIPDNELFTDATYITMFASMFVGMSLLSSTATTIAEDREKKSLRFLMMAGVKSHEYLLGIGGVYLVCALVVGSLFTILMPGLSLFQGLIMLASLLLGAAASILCGASIGMMSKNEQEAISIGTAAGMFLGFGPMIANFNETVERLFSIFYTMNFIYDDFNAANTVRRFTIILANIAVFALMFVFIYSKQELAKKGEINMKRRKTIVTSLVAALIAAVATGGYFIWQNAGYITTDNARVTTTFIPVSSNTSGMLERFTLYEGKHVYEDEVLGWVEQGEAMRAPTDGFVISTAAVRGQNVATLEPLAMIADKNSIHIQANIEETYILRIQPGQSAAVTIDGLGNHQFTGYISFIGNITQAELSGNILSNTGGNFTRRTHLIPVEITLTDDIDLTGLIGVNARVRIPVRN